MFYALRNVWPPYCAWPENVAHVVALYYGYEQWSLEYIRRIRASVRYCVLHHTVVHKFANFKFIKIAKL